MLAIPTFVKDVSGQICLNPATDDVGGCFLVPKSQGFNIPAAVGDAFGTTNFQIETPSDVYAQPLSLIGLHGADESAATRTQLLTSIYESARGSRALQNYPIPADHVFGTQIHPFFLDEQYACPLLMGPQQVVYGTFYNPSTAGAAAYSLNMEATRVKAIGLSRSENLRNDIERETQRAIHKSPYWFAPENTIAPNQHGISIPVGGNATGIFWNQRSDLVLMITGIMATAVNTGSTGDTEAIATAQIFTPQYDMAISNQGIAITSCAGNSQFVHHLLAPLVVRPNDKFRVVFQNLVTNGSPLKLFFTFFCVGVYVDPSFGGAYNTSGEYAPPLSFEVLKTFQALEGVYA